MPLRIILSKTCLSFPCQVASISVAGLWNTKKRGDFSSLPAVRPMISTRQSLLANKTQHAKTQLLPSFPQCIRYCLNNSLPCLIWNRFPCKNNSYTHTVWIKAAYPAVCHYINVSPVLSRLTASPLVYQSVWKRLSSLTTMDLFQPKPLLVTPVSHPSSRHHAPDESCPVYSYVFSHVPFSSFQIMTFLS